MCISIIYEYEPQENHCPINFFSSHMGTIPYPFLNMVLDPVCPFKFCGIFYRLFFDEPGGEGNTQRVCKEMLQVSAVGHPVGSAYFAHTGHAVWTGKPMTLSAICVRHDKEKAELPA